MKLQTLRFAVLIAFLPAPSVWAQWQTSAATGLRYVQTSEFAVSGQKLVQEQGWLPGFGIDANYIANDWQIRASGSLYRNEITYDGRLQNGVPYSTNSSTALGRIDVEAARLLGTVTRVTAAAEWDYWRRDIHGQQTVSGMYEKTSSWRLLIGAQTRLLQLSMAQLFGKASLVLAQPEQVNIQFGNQVFDDAEFSTKAAVGFRTALRLQSTAVQNIAMTTEFDWLRVPRSNDFVLRKNGMPTGFITQPEHVRRAVTMRIEYRF